MTFVLLAEIIEECKIANISIVKNLTIGYKITRPPKYI